MNGIYHKDNIQKKHALFNILYKQTSDIVLLQEWSLHRCYTNQIENYVNPFTNFENIYKIYNNTYSDIAILIKHQISHKEVKYGNIPRKPKYQDNTNVQAIQIKVNNKIVEIGTFYISPTSQSQYKIDQLFKYLTKTRTKHKIYLGDSNVKHTYRKDN